MRNILMLNNGFDYAPHNLVMWCIFFINHSLDNESMRKVNTDKKLELVKAVRMQNQYDRQLFRMREGFLYSELPEERRRELYSLEAPMQPSAEGKSRSLANFRIRFVIAILFLVSFILCDVYHISFGKEDADTFYERMKSSTNIEELIGRIK